MKQRTLALEGLDLARLLREASKNDVVFLSRRGEISFALMPADDGDQEVLALRSNPTFLAYLDGCKKRAREGPTKTLDEIRQLYGLSNGQGTKKAGKKSRPRR